MEANLDSCAVKVRLGNPQRGSASSAVPDDINECAELKTFTCRWFWCSNHRTEMGECKVCPYCCKQEFQWTNFGLNHDDASLFTKSQWPRFPRGGFVIYRVMLALIVTGWLAFNIVDEIRTFYYYDYRVWFAYATNWGFLALAILLIFLAIQDVVYYCRPHCCRPDGSLPVNLKFTWMLYNMACNSNMVITICFWFFLIFMDSSFYFRSVDSETKHLFNSLIVILDLFVSATPIRLLHFVYPIMLGLSYALFNIVYYLLDGPGPDGHNHYVYAVMDWNKPLLGTGIVFLGLGLCVLCQVFMFGIYKLRMLIFDKIYPCIKHSGDETSKIIEEENNHNYESFQPEERR